MDQEKGGTYLCRYGSPFLILFESVYFGCETAATEWTSSLTSFFSSGMKEVQAEAIVKPMYEWCHELCYFDDNQISESSISLFLLLKSIPVGKMS